MRLEVYVAEHCAGCAEALRMVAAIRREFGHVAVDVIDIVKSPERDQKRIFSVPTWVLDGRTLSLGNPRMEDLRRAIERETR